MSVVDVPRARTPLRGLPVQPANPSIAPRLSVAPGRLRIAMLAPPWISVPPPGYGGVESVVSA